VDGTGPPGKTLAGGAVFFFPLDVVDFALGTVGFSLGAVGFALELTCGLATTGGALALALGLDARC